MDLIIRMKIIIGRCPAFARFLRGAKRRVLFLLYGYDRSLYSCLRLFAPYGAGDPRVRIGLTLQSASQTLPLLAQLANAHSCRHAEEMTGEQFCQLFDGQVGARDLQQLFIKFGSDKSTFHDYHHVYGSLFQDPSSVTNVLEIGLGSNNLDVVSNMGEQGRPGASLRAFREYLPNAGIYGADIDKRILFQEDRIQTFYVDQTDIDSFSELVKLNLRFDLIIDDGLHSPNANIAVLLFGLKRLAPGGWLLIEDIRQDAKPVFQIVASLLSSNYRSFIIEAKKGLIFAVADQRLNEGR